MRKTSKTKNDMVHVLDHPLIQHKLTLMRKKDTSTNKFRTLMREVAMLVGYEVTREMTLTHEKIETPLASMNAPVLEKKKMALITVMRAGYGLLDGMLALMPTARVGHIGLYREVKAQSIVEYYFKLPQDISKREALVLDPMLASGQSAVIAVKRLKECDPRAIRFVCLLASPEGIEQMQAHHPDVPIYTAAIDKGLNEDGYIIPGMGDAGDRLFGTI